MIITIPTNAKKLINRLTESGYEAFAVGGCVRDALIGSIPHDWDICTNAVPEQMKACFTGFTTFDAGIKHGTLSVVIDGETFEVTTYRIDGTYSDNRHPNCVSFTSDIVRDLARRDFTVNAMAYNDLKGIIDPFGGKADLKNRIIRCVGNPDDRFNEDALRILRALRFSSRLGFQIEEKTAASIHKNAHLLTHISAERIRDELTEILCGERAQDILNTYRDVIAVFIPEIAETFDFDQRNKHHLFDIYSHITHSVGIVTNQPLTRLVMLFHDIGKARVCTQDADGTRHFKGHQQVSADMAKVILQRLRFPNTVIDDCLKLIVYHDVRFNGSQSQVKRMLNKLGEDNMRLLFAVQYADIMSQSAFQREEKLQMLAVAKKQFESVIAENACFSLKQLAVNGNDLIDMGITDGKQIGKILNCLLGDVIDDKTENDRNTLLLRAKEYYISI